MGIKQTRTLPSGFQAEYARIVSLDCVGVDNNRADIVLFWYKDKAARDAGAQPAESERHIVMLTEKEVAAIQKVIYESEAFRALNPEAEDVIEDEVEDEVPEGDADEAKKEGGK
ncbi:MAG: hypothetical protein JXM71_00510 [Spirochaetales bacterium]|nr:hypothetical protein [Spirochaetales bacterium]